MLVGWMLPSAVCIYMCTVRVSVVCGEKGHDPPLAPIRKPASRTAELAALGHEIARVMVGGRKISAPVGCPVLGCVLPCVREPQLGAQLHVTV